jgi:hypothetical protein
MGVNVTAAARRAGLKARGGRIEGREAHSTLSFARWAVVLPAPMTGLRPDGGGPGAKTGAAAAGGCAVVSDQPDQTEQDILERDMPGPLDLALRQLLFAVATLDETDYEIAIAGAAAAQGLAERRGDDDLAVVWEALHGVVVAIGALRSA